MFGLAYLLPDCWLEVRRSCDRPNDTLGWTALFEWDMGEGALHEEEKK
jgi:hypothetical protein